MRFGYALGLIVTLLSACASSTTDSDDIREMAFAFPTRLDVCAGMRVSNQPRDRYSQFAQITDRVALARAPVETGCLSSGFGKRRSGFHKGIDLHHRTAVDIYAAGNGVVMEVTKHRDYGRTILISHGDDVFTRYAHIEWIPPRIHPGYQVSLGEPIATTGHTGNARARHLHYEILFGDYNNPAKSFGLTPIDVLAAPPAH